VIIDANGVRVSGPVTAKRARVLWKDGVLYIVTAVDRVQALSCEQPRKWGGGYQADIDGAILMIQVPSCGCHRNARLGALTHDQIIAAASVDA
jgi:hypothetical protein